ncbi:MAG: AraC family transcriptional regulator ligand-binding domain-containing protein [Myxococcota bacterium]
MTTRSAAMTSGTTTRETDIAGSVSAAMVRSFIDFSCTFGLDREALLREAALTKSALEQDDNRLPLATFVKAMRVAKRDASESALPVLFAAHADFSEFSIAGLIANASRTMLDALIQLNRYGRLAIDPPYEGDVPLAFERSVEADWIVDRRIFASPCLELVELAFTYLITGPRRFLPRPHTLSVHVTYGPPKHRAVYDEVWRCPVHFDTERNALQLAKWVAGHEVRLQPAYAFGILTAHADRMLEDLRAKETFAGRIESMIVPELHTGAVSIHWAADRLGLSRQSVYRRLKSEGTTFETLLESVRRRLALEYLEGGKVTVSETAFLLGYADSSPFARAFKRWTGRSPGSYRNAKQTL